MYRAVYVVVKFVNGNIGATELLRFPRLGVPPYLLLLLVSLIVLAWPPFDESRLSPTLSAFVSPGLCGALESWLTEKDVLTPNGRSESTRGEPALG